MFIALWGGSFLFIKAQAGGGGYHYQAPAQSELSSSKQGHATQSELSCLAQVSRGWLLLSYMHSRTSLSHMGPYDGPLASDIS